MFLLSESRKSIHNLCFIHLINISSFLANQTLTLYSKEMDLKRILLGSFLLILSVPCTLAEQEEPKDAGGACGEPDDCKGGLLCVSTTTLRPSFFLSSFLLHELPFPDSSRCWFLISGQRKLCICLGHHTSGGQTWINCSFADKSND